MNSTKRGNACSSSSSNTTRKNYSCGEPTTPQSWSKKLKEKIGPSGWPTTLKSDAIQSPLPSTHLNSNKNYLMTSTYATPERRSYHNSISHPPSAHHLSTLPHPLVFIPTNAYQITPMLAALAVIPFIPTAPAKKPPPPAAAASSVAVSHTA
jgi:hypothetical protein